MLRGLRDDDLSVVQAALSLNRLSETITPHYFLDAVYDVLQRCITILLSSEYGSYRICLYQSSMSISDDLSVSSCLSSHKYAFCYLNGLLTVILHS